MQSVPITTKVVRSIPVHGEVYPIQNYVIKCVSDLRQVGGFLRVFRFPPINQTDRHDILLKVSINTILPNRNQYCENKQTNKQTDMPLRNEKGCPKS